MAGKDVELPDLLAGEEGISTLVAQFTRRDVDRIIRVIRRERMKGTPEETIAKAMERDLGNYNAHSRQLLLRLASDETVPDDFPPETVTESKQPKPNTLELTLAAPVPGIQLHTLVHQAGQEWLVMACENSRWTLKLLQ